MTLMTVSDNKPQEMGSAVTTEIRIPIANSVPVEGLSVNSVTKLLVYKGCTSFGASLGNDIG
jgi:hypothetical protein